MPRRRILVIFLITAELLFGATNLMAGAKVPKRVPHACSSAMMRAIKTAEKHFKKKCAGRNTYNDLVVESTDKGWCITFIKTYGWGSMIYAKDGSKIMGLTKKIYVDRKYQVTRESQSKSYERPIMFAKSFESKEGKAVYQAVTRELELLEVTTYLNECFNKTEDRSRVKFHPVDFGTARSRPDLWGVEVEVQQEHFTFHCGCSSIGYCSFFIYLRKDNLDWMAVSLVW